MNLREKQLYLFTQDEMGPVANRQHVINVSSVPQRSPFRYPGGKTWLVPTARKWFTQSQQGSYLVEPFAGGGIISLTAVAEHYFDKVTMVELDNDMAATWETILSDDHKWLTSQIANFKVTVESINGVIARSSEGVKELALSTIVRNRTNHGGILARGSGLIKSGEKGKGLGSRWYPETLIKRITDVNRMRERITFVHGDAFDYMEKLIDDTNAFFFIDPPYTVAGRRLYTHFEVDHHRIFDIASRIKGHFLLTYDDTPEVRKWAEEFNLPYMTIPMQTTHIITKEELLISDNFEWYGMSKMYPH